LMTKADNKKFSKHKDVMGVGYQKYDNYDALEVPFTDAIPSDQKGVMGVPISFLGKYNPEQFEIIGMSANGLMPDDVLVPDREKYDRPYLGGKRMYVRLFIRHRMPGK
ncbi:MAG: adenine-specific methyltransferase EcoRI family protein, partial [Actinomycetes bacterium]